MGDQLHPRGRPPVTAALTLAGTLPAHAATDPGPRKTTTKTRVIDRDTCRYRVPDDLTALSEHLQEEV